MAWLLTPSMDLVNLSQAVVIYREPFTNNTQPDSFTVRAEFEKAGPVVRLNWGLTLEGADEFIRTLTQVVTAGGVWKVEKAKTHLVEL